MDLQNYLARIGYSGPLEPDYATLSGLHRAHLLAVPFENLDIHAGRPITVGPEAAYLKLVGERRGGFCYEHNGLFGAILEQIGFEVTYLSARVARPNGEWGPEFDHLALRVTGPGAGTYLADVGFGDGFLDPLRWPETGPQFQAGRAYRLAETSEGRVYGFRREDGEWVNRYNLSTEPRRLADFSEMCRYHQTSPESGFTRSAVISLAQPGGRITLTGQQLIVTRQGQRIEQPIPDRAAYFEALAQHFGVILPPALRQRLESALGPVARPPVMAAGVRAYYAE
jgi:N-hydroxyarylamine O-acetyltransferase